jgi:small subunit ribosomal protein S21
MSVRVVVGEGEHIVTALRRFRRLVNQSGIRYHEAVHSYFVKPGEKRRYKKILAKVRKRQWSHFQRLAARYGRPLEHYR